MLSIGYLLTQLIWAGVKRGTTKDVHSLISIALTEVYMLYHRAGAFGDKMESVVVQTDLQLRRPLHLPMSVVPIHFVFFFFGQNRLGKIAFRQMFHVHARIETMTIVWNKNNSILLWLGPNTTQPKLPIMWFYWNGTHQMSLNALHGTGPIHVAVKSCVGIANHTFSARISSNSYCFVHAACVQCSLTRGIHLWRVGYGSHNMYFMIHWTTSRIRSPVNFPLCKSRHMSPKSLETSW